MKSWKKGFYNVYKKCKECLYNILGELQGKCAKCFCFLSFFFNKITMEGKQEEHKTQQNVCKKWTKSFYNIYKKCKECLYNILGELQGNCAKCFFFFQ